MVPIPPTFPQKIKLEGDGKGKRKFFTCQPVVFNYCGIN